MTSKCGKDLIEEAQPSVSLMILPRFDFLCGLCYCKYPQQHGICVVLYYKEVTCCYSVIASVLQKIIRKNESKRSLQPTMK